MGIAPAAEGRARPAPRATAKRAPGARLTRPRPRTRSVEVADRLELLLALGLALAPTAGGRLRRGVEAQQARQALLHPQEAVDRRSVPGHGRLVEHAPDPHEDL